MSDLDQAVQAEIDAYRPATVPSFDALAGRKRARDRRRLATGGAALSAVALSAAFAVPSLIGGRPDRLPAVASSPAPSPAPSGGPVPPDRPVGAEICKEPTAVDGADECFDVGPEQAGRLAETLATGRPLQPGAAECMALPVAVYRVTFRPASGLVDPVVWSVPSGLCLPMTVGGKKYGLPDDAQAAVAGIWDSAGPAAAPVDADAAALVERCLSGLTATPVPGLVGRTEQEAFPPAVRTALRVLARDGDCTDERLAGDGETYVVLESGRVVWAGRLDDPTSGPVPRVGDTRAYLARMDDCAERKGIAVQRLPGGGSQWGVPPGEDAALRRARAECQAELGVSSESPVPAPPAG